jgi:RNA polymerase sigma factor (sigma-70 family)
MLTEIQDSELIAEFLRSRSEVSFLQIYRRHTPRLYLFALRLCSGKHPEAEDIVQESWIRAVQKLSTFRREAQLRHWLMGIVCNCYRELQRSKKPEFSLDQAANETTLAAEPSDLEQLIGRLPNGYREVLILHDIYGYTHEETSAFLDIQPGTSKSQLFEARKKLRGWLTKEEK